MSSETYKSATPPPLGSKIVIRLNFCDEQGEVVEEKHYFGLLDRISDEEAVIKHPSTGEEVSLPAHFGSYLPNPGGEYQLSSREETVSNPDFLTEWTLRISSASS